jgi:hypothetical protein
VKIIVKQLHVAGIINPQIVLSAIQTPVISTWAVTISLLMRMIAFVLASAALDSAKFPDIY